MKDILRRICELQPLYSSSNTPEMQERGALIRSALADELRMRIPLLQKSFHQIFDDLSVEASDGIGRKTEAPWVRLFSKAMSPNPREGFYIVLHFAADGSAFFITVGCGSTTWSGGDLRAIPDEELRIKTGWARSVVQQRFSSLEPFDDEMNLGATAPLPRTFEKATAFAKRISKGSLSDEDIDLLLAQASARLSEIYLAQLDKRDVALGDQDIEEIFTIAKPLRKGRSQGLGLTAAERKAVEMRAMAVAREYLEGIGFTVKDVSLTESYDLLATNPEREIKVEVKGTTSDLCDVIMMTKNEVELHRREKGRTGLIIVSRIQLDREELGPSATRGKLEALLEWDVDAWMAEPIAFRLSRI